MLRRADLAEYRALVRFDPAHQDIAAAAGLIRLSVHLRYTVDLSGIKRLIFAVKFKA
jgi:hypothetical protein